MMAAEKSSIDVDDQKPALYKQHPSAALTVEKDESFAPVEIGL
jgi:hypothetical protein